MSAISKPVTYNLSTASEFVKPSKEETTDIDFSMVTVSHSSYSTFSQSGSFVSLIGKVEGAETERTLAILTPAQPAFELAFNDSEYSSFYVRKGEAVKEDVEVEMHRNVYDLEEKEADDMETNLVDAQTFKKNNNKKVKTAKDKEEDSSDSDSDSDSSKDSGKGSSDSGSESESEEEDKKKEVHVKKDKKHPGKFDDRKKDFKGGRDNNRDNRNNKNKGGVNCFNCDFTANSMDELFKHKDDKHPRNDRDRRGGGDRKFGNRDRR